MKQITEGEFEASSSDVSEVFPSGELWVSLVRTSVAVCPQYSIWTLAHSLTCTIWTQETLPQRQLWSGQSPALADAVPSVVFCFNFTLWRGLTASADKSERSQPLFLALWLIIFRLQPVYLWIICSFLWFNWRVSNSAQQHYMHLCNTLQLHPLCLLQTFVHPSV